MKPSLQQWENFYNEGIAYCDSAVYGASRGKYTPEVLHGLSSMAAEKLLMSVLLYNGIMPMGHTFFDLIAAASEFFSMDDSLKKILLEMDEMIPLCSLDPAKSWRIDPVLVPSLIFAAEMTRKAVDTALSSAGS